MQTITQRLKLAQNEVHRTQHDQDLIEVPKRARLDREAELKRASENFVSQAKESQVSGH